MSLVERLRDTYLRIDARSLGLFRVAMGVALVGDWAMRWSNLRAFYSNEGVLQNHAHLYSLKEDGPPRVWSLLHAFSTPTENRLVFLLALLVYLFFLIGYKTRAFHVLSLVVLVSLSGRNIYVEGPANYVAIAILAATAFLPCGSRFSIDSLRDSFKRHDEKDGAALNDRSWPDERTTLAERSAGWSPTSLAALAVLLQLTIIFVATWRQQNGAQWHDGTALHYSLWVERWVSDLGMRVRGAPPALLAAWTRVLHVTPLAVPVLLFLPVARYARPIAFALMVFYGLSYGLLFSFGLWGWTFVAAAFLVIPRETWDRYQSRFAKGRALTVIYDADCGICLWLVRLFRRLDLRGHLTFQGNDALTVAPGQKPPYRTAADSDAPRVLHRRIKHGAPVESVPLPAEVTDELVAGTVVAVSEKGQVFTEGRAIAAIVESLPLGALLSLPLIIPGTAGLWDALYRIVPPRRYAISEALGMAACGVPTAAPSANAPEGASAADAPAPSADPASADPPSRPAAPAVAPSTRTRRAITGALRDVGALLLLGAALAQTGKNNPWPAALTLPQPRFLAAITGWPRMLARYDVIAPEAPVEDGVLVIDGQTRAGRSIDPLTGREPDFDVPRFRLGPLWGSYTARLRQKDADLEKSFRDYLVKGGPAWSTDVSDNHLTGLDAYWLPYKSPPPGGKTIEVEAPEKLFTHSRGGMKASAIPVIRPLGQ